MNVLYVMPTTQDDPTITLLTPNKHLTGPLSTLRALVGQAGARGAVTLVLDGTLKPIEDLPTEKITQDQLLSLMDTRLAGTVVVSDPPVTASVHDTKLIGQVRAALRGTRVSLRTLVPLASAALRAADSTDTTVTVNVTPHAYEVTTFSDLETVTRSVPRNARMDLERAVKNGVSRLLPAGMFPQALIIHPDDESVETVDVPGVSVMNLPLSIVLRAVQRGAQEGDTPDATATSIRAGRTLHRSLSTQTTLPKAAIAAAALAALVNLGLFGLTKTTQGAVSRLQDEQVTLQAQAAAVEALRAENSRLEQQNAQATALTGNKGTAHTDLPLIAGRLGTTRATISSLSGPNPVQPGDLTFGGPVTHAYEVTAFTDDVQGLARTMQAGGVRADIRRVTCAAEDCEVSLRVALNNPAAQTPTGPSPTTPTGTPTPASSGAAPTTPAAAGARP